MVQHHNWSLTELDNMIPYERAIYVDMLKEWVDSENSKMEQEQHKRNKKWQIDLIYLKKY